MSETATKRNNWFKWYMTSSHPWVCPACGVGNGPGTNVCGNCLAEKRAKEEQKRREKRWEVSQ